MTLAARSSKSLQSRQGEYRRFFLNKPFHCVAAIFFLHIAVPTAEADTIKLGCNGEMHVKHYGDRKLASYSAEVDIQKLMVVLYFAETTYNLDTKGGPLTSKQDVEKLELKIYEIKKPFYFLEKIGTVNDNAIVMNKSWTGKYYKVEIKPDDFARGYLNADTGKLEIETRYYKTDGIEFEYGWFLDAQCRKSESVIE